VALGVTNTWKSRGVGDVPVTRVLRLSNQPKVAAKVMECIAIDMVGDHSRLAWQNDPMHADVPLWAILRPHCIERLGGRVETRRPVLSEDVCGVSIN